MATIDWPSDIHPAQWDWGIRKAGVSFMSPFNGTHQAIDFVAERWMITVTLPNIRHGDRSGKVRSLLNYLAGGVNRVRMWDHGSGTWATPGIPTGTMRGTPTVNATASRGNTTLTIAGAGAGATLLPGDKIGAGGQLFEVFTAATANGAGVMTIPLVNRVRATIASGSAVTWQRPTAEFVMPSMTARHAQIPAFLTAEQFDLEEVW
jgi:hypothetical protein